MEIEKNQDGTFTITLETKPYGDFGSYEALEETYTLDELFEISDKILKAIGNMEAE